MAADPRTVLRKGKAMREAGQVRVAVVGAGAMAREHIRAFRDVPGVVVAGIHSRTREKAEELAREYGIPGVYDSVAELHDRTEAELVVVTVFETSMRSVSIECSRFPWTLFLEKPPGIDIGEAEEIRAAADGRDVLVALNRRFLSATQTVANDLDTIDEPRFIHVQDQQDRELAKSLGHPPRVVENWMYANSIHLIDYLRFLGRGAVRKVTPLTGRHPDQPNVVLAGIEFDSGDVGLYEGIWHGPGPWAVTVSTGPRRWELRPLERAAVQRAGERRLETIETHEWDASFKPGFRLQAEQAIAAVRGEPSKSPTLDEALDTMRLIERIFQPADV